MNDDELKKLWQQQPLRDPGLSPAQVISAMKGKTTQLRRTLLARDVRELLACVVVGVIFGIYFFTERAPMTRLGALITVAGSIFIAGRILHARRATPAAKPGATVVESLRAELHSIRTQSQLLRSVFWWYLLPLAVGTLVFVWGTPSNSLFFNVSFTLFSLALDVFIYRLNQRARSTQLLPVERQLESLLRSAETGEALDETQVAHLRPIILSMAAADRVKPVEFKVAFWQLAIYGVPGIVGIWLISIFSLTVHNRDWLVNERAVENPAAVVRTGSTSETNRYFLVTRRLVELLNAGDYAAVQRLYSPDMSKFSPPKETADFYTGIAGRYGKIEKFRGPTGNGYHGWTAFGLDYQHGEMTMSLALDADDKVSGIDFQPVPISYANIKDHIKPFLLHLFSWRHLLWGGVSFLVGLLYTWLIQKTTRRAVGISTLGIHLQNGNSLVLWDEIKEVRPFRFLNIRNLWLIAESGEKTRMHWTPLERHSDVQAAVDKFAPADHPIRKYLALL